MVKVNKLPWTNAETSAIVRFIFCIASCTVLEPNPESVGLILLGHMFRTLDYSMLQVKKNKSHTLLSSTKKASKHNI
jgi:hypothetical protein